MMAEYRSGDNIIVGAHECFTLPGDCKVYQQPQYSLRKITYDCNS